MKFFPPGACPADPLRSGQPGRYFDILEGVISLTTNIRQLCVTRLESTDDAHRRKA